jgi:hypothetical protein
VARIATPPLKGDGLRDFSGGPNLRDAESELTPNECEDAYNVTFDERGGVTSRLGYVKDNATAFSGGLVKNQYWSSILGAKITQAGSSLYLGTTNTARKTFTTSELVTFAETNSLVVACHPTDGLFTSPDGIAWAAVADPDAPKGTCIAVWQNKVYVGASNGKVSWSAAGDSTNWTATDFNKLWEKDQQGIVAMHIGSGQDILGKPGLLCFKQESVYRINDSTTGSYTTVDATVGAAGPLAVVGIGSKVFAIGKRGIFWWREDQAGMVDASDRFKPLWRDQTNLGQLALWAAGRKGNRAFFSLTRAGSTANDLALEYHTEQNWIAPRSDAMSCYATSTGGSETLYGGSPTVSGQTYQLESGGSDDGAAISWRFQTRWIQPNGGFESSLWQVRVHGRGAGTLTVRSDYASAGGDGQPFDLTGIANTYDSGLFYDSGVLYAEPVYQNTEPFYNVISVCRQFSLIFSGSSTTTFTAPQILGSGTNPQVGYFGLYGIEWLFTQLGLS